MKSEWQTLSLSEAGVKLLDCDHRTPPAASEGYPYVTIPQIKDGRLDLSDVRRITQEHFREWTKKTRPMPNDVVVVRRCSPGDSAHVPSGVEFALGQNLVLLRSDGTKVVPEFLRWLIQGPAWWEQVQRFLNVGAVFDSLKCREIPNFQLPIPPRDHQLLIAEVLGSLDDKINLNRRMNQTLEEVAQALFRSWFMDFDPVRAKAEGRQPEGMDSATAALFSSELVDSELGKVPAGWLRRRVSDLVEGVFDGPHATPPEASHGPIFLGIKNLTGTTIDLSNARYISEADWPAWTKRVEPRQGDIVFTYEATLGHFALIPAGLRCCLGRRTALIRPKANYHFLFHWFVGEIFQRFLKKHTHPGATVDRILLTDFPSYPVLAAPQPLIDRFEAVAAPLWSMIHANQSQSRTLSELRDTLMPKLLSGEIRVREAEAQLAAST